MLTMSIPSFIDIDVLDQTKELRSYLKELGGEVTEENAGDAVKDLIQCIQASETCWTEVSSDTDLETVFNGIISMLFLLPQTQIDEPVTLFSQVVSKFPKGDKKGAVRLRILSNLFHGLNEKSPQKAEVYLSLLRLARDADQAQAVITDLDQVKKWISEWDIGVQKVQSVYRGLHGTLISAKMSEQATKVMIELLGTYTEDNASQARDDAQRCIVTCLEDPNTFLLDHLLTLKPVKFLEGAPIHDLLTIFVTGKLSQYQQFYKNNKEFIQGLGLSHDENLRKMRILTFMQMAENRKDIDYSSIQSEMDVKEEDVEHFIIDGLSHEENLRKMRILTFMQMAENPKDIDYSSIQSEMDVKEEDVEHFIIDGLSHDENLRMMKILTFMQMAENRKDIDYSSIQSEMDVKEEDVEHFIIDVLRTKVVQAKIYQLQKEATTVAFPTSNTFDMAEQPEYDSTVYALWT